jgi:hypothetical protein
MHWAKDEKGRFFIPDYEEKSILKYDCSDDSIELVARAGAF